MRVVVLGLGGSATLYRADNSFTIGVNDAEKYHKVNHLIVFDKPSVFSKERLDIIKKSTPDLFLSHLYDWSFMPTFHKVELAMYRSDISQIDKPNVYPYSIMTPFIAIVHAYKLGAKEIILYGVDINDHATLSNPIKKERVLQDIRTLNQFLIRRNIELLVYNKSSLLSKVLKYLSNE